MTGGFAPLFILGMVVILPDSRVHDKGPRGTELYGMPFLSAWKCVDKPGPVGLAFAGTELVPPLG